MSNTNPSQRQRAMCEPSEEKYSNDPGDLSASLLYEPRNECLPAKSARQYDAAHGVYRHPPSNLSGWGTAGSIRQMQRDYLRMNGYKKSATTEPKEEQLFLLWDE